MDGFDYVRNKDYIQIVKEMIKDLKFGTITIQVQDQKVVQINREEKVRIKN